MIYRSFEQSACIRREQKYYENKAKQKGIKDIPNLPEIKLRLKAKLGKRGIRPKVKENLHILYASRPVPWDTQNIVPAIAKYSKLTTYYNKKQGFNDELDNWLEIRDEMNDNFVEFIRNTHKNEPIDLVLTYFSGYQISPEAIEEINSMGIVTASFHLDDRLSFRGKTIGDRRAGPSDVCKYYDINLTQAPESLIKYYAEGAIAMVWPLAANQDFFYPRNSPFKYDVSFVGTSHGFRKPFIKYLKDSGIKVEAFGRGWKNGFISNEAVPEIFSASRINLNFGNIAYTNYQCCKARDFEIPISGGLMLTSYNEHLGKYFDLEKEVFTFKNREECLKQIKRLLADEELCAQARIKARDRALKCHKWEDRIEGLLEVIGYK